MLCPKAKAKARRGISTFVNGVCANAARLCDCDELGLAKDSGLDSFHIAECEYPAIDWIED